MRTKFIKAITLISFVILITGFVAYRSDVFKGDDLKKDLPIDSPIVTHKDPAMFSSSKSGVIFKEKKIDLHETKTGEKEQKKDTTAKVFLQEENIMSSSKSMIIATRPGSVPSTTLRTIISADSVFKKK